MRTLTPAGQALLDRIIAGEQMPLVQLIEVHLAPVIYLTTAGIPLPWAGNTWQPVGLSIEPVGYTTGGEIDQLAFLLPGVTSDQLALALTESVEGKVVRVYDALVNPATGAVVDAVLAWAGSLNVPSIADGPTAAVSWTAEHRAVQAMRSKPSRYTNDEQQRLYSGDTCFDFDPATDAAALAWPAASYFKQ